ncbi:MAG: hypothetical protein IJ689_05785 [Alphaproteobacteria bacterium]|nr:hypothetical protein [Alphaproteobacteria bacterium]
MKKSLYLLAAITALGLCSQAYAGDHYDSWIDKETAEIAEDYDEAIIKIDNSSFSAEQKAVLKEQALANKELALANAKAVDAQIKKNMEARKGFIDFSKHSKENKKARKVFKEIDDIL